MKFIKYLPLSPHPQALQPASSRMGDRGWQGGRTVLGPASPRSVWSPHLHRDLNVLIKDPKSLSF